MKKNDLHRMLAWLSQVLTCPVCENHYASEDTQLIENRAEKKSAGDKSVLIHSDCQNCLTSVMFNVSLLGQEIFSVGLISDLTSRDAVKFRNVKAISCDEVIELHSLLQNFDGNFEKAFSQFS